MSRRRSASRFAATATATATAASTADSRAFAPGATFAPAADARPATGASGVSPAVRLVVRLTWLFFGVLGLAALAAAIARQPAWTFGWRDAAFALLLAATLAARYVDVTRLDGETANGRPSTRADLRLYLVGLTGAALAAWGLAQSVSLFG